MTRFGVLNCVVGQTRAVVALDNNGKVLQDGNVMDKAVERAMIRCMAGVFGMLIVGAAPLSAQTPAPVRSGPQQLSAAPLAQTMTPPASAPVVSVTFLAADGYAVQASMPNPADPKQMIVTMQKLNYVYFAPCESACWV